MSAWTEHRQAVKAARARLDAPHWRRLPEKDKRIAHGDDFAGDAWINRYGEVRYTAVGHGINGFGLDTE